MNERFTIYSGLADANGSISYGLYVFGDELAKREGYKVHKDIDAVHYYLCRKFNWTPATVRALHPNDIDFLLAEEMHGFVYPPEARP